MTYAVDAYEQLTFHLIAPNEWCPGERIGWKMSAMWKMMFLGCDDALVVRRGWLSIVLVEHVSSS